ncbi:hypothetical protein NP233_g5444 [Leucocoprinus birnbaumii]|uniref:DUF1793-domain-containing protein n=1 Tax=Leucocoprinus birnbaumii TaxID=56174 RepID=A0AAD5VSU6_9AGAR|nr:hypothetical protein NP233_g5444 [Leucocoprinus birnbaumii]
MTFSLLCPIIAHFLVLLVNAQSPKRIPFLPLAVKTPYLNTWLHNSDFAPDDDRAQFFTDDRKLGWTGFIRVDDQNFQWIGTPYKSNKTLTSGLTLTPTKTIFRFEAGPIQFNVTFFTPIEPSDYALQSVPFSYLYIDGFSVGDSLSHTVQVYSDISAEWVSRDDNAVVEWDTVETDSAVYHHATRREKNVMQDDNNFSDDSVVYYVTLKRSGSTWRTGSTAVCRSKFIENGTLDNNRDTDFRPVNSRGWPGFAHATDLGTISSISQPDPVVWAVGLVRSPLLRYTGPARDQVGFYASKFQTDESMIMSFIEGFDGALNRSMAFDNTIASPAGTVSSEYADILSIVTRQLFASLDITVSKPQAGNIDPSEVRIFMRDMGDSLRTNPVDVLYGAYPAFLFFNPTILRDLLKPLLEQQRDSQYPSPDLGNTYPMIGGNSSDDHTIAIENTGSMLIMIYAHALKSGDGSLISAYYSTIQRWADHLASTAFNFSADTITTDGTSGSKSTNLALKTIWGIYSAAKIGQAAGSSNSTYLDLATTLLENWTQSALTDSHIKLNFNESDSWGVIYNLFPDFLFNAKMITNEILTRQANFYSGQSGLQPALGFQSAQANIIFPHWNLLAAATIPDNLTHIRDQLIGSIHERAFDGTQEFSLPMRYDVASGNAAAGGSASAIFGAAYGLLARDIQNVKITLDVSLPPSSRGSKNIGPIVGGVVGGIFGAGLVAFSFFLWYRRRRLVLREKAFAANHNLKPHPFVPATGNAQVASRPGVYPGKAKGSIAADGRLALPPTTRLLRYQLLSAKQREALGYRFDNMGPGGSTTSDQTNASDGSDVGTDAIRAEVALLRRELEYVRHMADFPPELAVQHNLVLNGSGRKLIHAPISLESVKSVLETATGSGIWVEAVAQLLPDTAELVGIDITSNLFPPTPPSNVKFLQRSVLDLPKDWTNKFDLVHQRLLLVGLRKEEWLTAFKEILRVLKPGGWFQLYEIDDWEECGPVQNKLRDLVTLLIESRGGHGIWPCGAAQWQKDVEDAGFQNVQVSWHGWPTGSSAGEEGALGKWNFLGFMRGCKAPILKAGGLGIVNSEEEFDELLVEVEKELDTRQGTRMRCVMMCGQKPV